MTRLARATKLLVGLAALSIFPIAYFIQPVLSDRISVCFFRTITGYRCPFCGLTRALAAAMHGRFRAAFHYHPLWALAAAILLWIGTAAMFDAGFGTDQLRHLRQIKSRVSLRALVVIIAIVWAINAMNV